MQQVPIRLKNSQGDAEDKSASASADEKTVQNTLRGDSFLLENMPAASPATAFVDIVWHPHRRNRGQVILQHILSYLIYILYIIGESIATP